MNTAINRYSAAVWNRNYLTWIKLIWPSLASNVVNPILFLFAFGFGLGSMVKDVGGVSYLAFVVPGMVAYATMFSASFETTASAFARFHMQKTWDATLATPVSLFELLGGELLWATTKAMISCVCVIVVALIWGGIPDLFGAIVAIPVYILGALCFGACGLAATAHARSWDFMNYFFTFWVTPMFMFSGTFFNIEIFPKAVQILTLILPMTHMLEVTRALMTGAPISLLKALVHIGFLLIMTAAAFWLAHSKLSKRLFD